MSNSHLPPNFATKSAKWLFCRVPYLVRYAPSGTYFVRVKVAGKIVKRSLKTKSESAAIRILPKEIKQLRAFADRKAHGGLTMADCALAYFANLKGILKPRSYEYREETWKAVKTGWAGLDEKPVASITKDACESWARKARSYSATRFNGCVQTLRGIIAVAGMDDPTADIQPAKVRITAPDLPTQEQFAALLKYLRKDARRKPAAFTVELLAYTGLRFDEARNLQRADVDLSKGVILARVTKNSEPRHVPIIGEARAIMKAFKAGAEVVNPRKVLQTFAASGGFSITPHKLRHLFATRCIECGVDVRTIAEWLGHKDRGKLLLQRYAHVRAEHSLAQAAKVRFG